MENNPVSKEINQNTEAQNLTGWAGFLDKAINFFKAQYGFFIIPLFVFITFGVALSTFGIWPFGKTIMASYDMLAQVCPILEHFFDVLSGESGLFHTFHLGGGMDMFGILAYCAVSPFTFMFLLAGEGGSIYMVSIVMPLKITCIGISGFLFLKRYFKGLPQYLQLVLALLYAYSGYMYVANTYIIWMDIMMWMPLLVGGFIEFSRHGKIRWLVLGLTVNVYCCFSIVCFSFLLLFPIFVCYILLCKSKSDYREYLSKLCLAFVLAIGLCLPILVPSLIAFMQAGRNTGLFSRVFKILSESQIKKGDLGVPLYEKFAYIVCDSTLLFLTVVYFWRSKKGDREAIFLYIALLFLFIPCIVDESMLLLNMGSYYSYALRFGFLNSIFLLYTAAKGLEEFVLSGEGESEVNKTKANVSMVITMILTVVGVVFTMLFFRFILNGKYEDSAIIKAIFGSNEEMKPFESFFALFAHSEGGLEGTVVLFVVMIVLLTAIAMLVKFKMVKLSDIIAFICILALSQPIFFNFALVRGDRQSGSGEKFDYYEEMLDRLDDEEIYRLKNYGYYISSDSPLILGTYSHTLFSSMADAKNLTAPQFFRYDNYTSKNSTRSNEGSVFSDSLMGYKYIIFDTADLKYSNKYYYTDTGISVHKVPSVKVSYTTAKNSTKSKKWENISKEIHGAGKWTSLSIKVEGSRFKGYMGGKLIYSFNMSGDEVTGIKAVTKNTFGSVKNLSVKNADGSTVSGKWVSDSNWTEENGVYTNSKASANIAFDGTVSGAFTASADVCFERGTASDDHIGLAITVSSGETYRIVIEPNVGYFLYKNDLVFPMAAVIGNAELNFEGLTRKKSFEEIAKVFGSYDVEIYATDGEIEVGVVEKLQKKLEKSKAEYKLVKNGIIFEPITAQKGQMLYLSYVNLDGYTAIVNGKEREIKQNSLDLMLIELDEGVNTVEIRYKSPYISFILIGIAMAGVIVAVCWFIYKKQKKLFEMLSKILPYMACALAVGLTAFFILYPTGICIYKYLFHYLKILI